MKTRAVRLYGKKDLRLEDFELPAIREDEILARVVSDSICMSTYKAASLGADHKRVPKDVAQNPLIVGHEMAGVIEEVGAAWEGKYSKGAKFAIQPALNYKGSMDSPGYSYRWCGGAATYIIMPREVMELGCLLDYRGEAFFDASLAEPMSCIIGAFHASYHTRAGSYEHRMGIAGSGKTAILAGAGPMGLGAVDYALHAQLRPALLVVTDVDASRLERARSIFPEEEARRFGVDLRFVDTGKMADPVAELRAISGGTGFDDVFVYAPVSEVVRQGGLILGRDGCLNFFAGPIDTAFSAPVNFYDVHYASTHIVGTTGGNTSDMLESLEMTASGRIRPAVMVTHIGGLDSAAEATLHLPDQPAGKKLIYTGIELPLTAIADFGKAAGAEPRFAELDAICRKHQGLWSAEAEARLLVLWGEATARGWGAATARG